MNAFNRMHLSSFNTHSAHNHQTQNFNSNFQWNMIWLVAPWLSHSTCSERLKENLRR